VLSRDGLGRSAGKRFFHDDADRQKFLRTLGQACLKTGWQVHAHCLMNNHFHLVIETPQPNLSLGMKRIGSKWAVPVMCPISWPASIVNSDRYILTQFGLLFLSDRRYQDGKELFKENL